MITIASIIYVIKAVVTGAIFFVWVVRYQNIVEEFKVYRLPSWLRDLVGVLKLSFAFMLHIPDATTVLFGSLGISLLMVAALVTHLRIKNPYKEFDEFINWPEVTGKATISKRDGQHTLEDQLAILPASLQTTKP